MPEHLDTSDFFSFVKLPVAKTNKTGKTLMREPDCAETSTTGFCIWLLKGISPFL